jgi:hypothetical protein
VQLPPNIRPEFLDQIIQSVKPNLGCPDARRGRQISIGFRVIGISRDDGCGRAAEKLGIVDLRLPGIGACHEDTCHCIENSAFDSALARLEVTRVLMQDRREDRLRCEVLDRAIGEILCKPFRVSLRALSITRFAVIRLADTGLQAVPDEGDGVKRGPRGDFELLADTQRRRVVRILQREKKLGKA